MYMMVLKQSPKMPTQTVLQTCLSLLLSNDSLDDFFSSLWFRICCSADFSVTSALL